MLNIVSSTQSSITSVIRSIDRQSYLLFANIFFTFFVFKKRVLDAFVAAFHDTDNDTDNRPPRRVLCWTVIRFSQSSLSFFHPRLKTDLTSQSIALLSIRTDYGLLTFVVTSTAFCFSFLSSRFFLILVQRGR